MGRATGRAGGREGIRSRRRMQGHDEVGGKRRKWEGKMEKIREDY